MFYTGQDKNSEKQNLFQAGQDKPSKKGFFSKSHKSWWTPGDFPPAGYLLLCQRLGAATSQTLRPKQRQTGCPWPWLGSEHWSRPWWFVSFFKFSLSSGVSYCLIFCQLFRLLSHQLFWRSHIQMHMWQLVLGQACGNFFLLSCARYHPWVDSVRFFISPVSLMELCSGVGQWPLVQWPLGWWPLVQWPLGLWPLELCKLGWRPLGQWPLEQWLLGQWSLGWWPLGQSRLEQCQLDNGHWDNGHLGDGRWGDAHLDNGHWGNGQRTTGTMPLRSCPVGMTSTGVTFHWDNIPFIFPGLFAVSKQMMLGLQLFQL